MDDTTLDKGSEESEEKEDIIHSTVSQLEEFFASPVWRDLEEYLNDSLKAHQILMETSEGVHLYRLQGAVTELRTLLNIPATLLEELKLDKEKKEGEEEEKGGEENA